MKSWFTYNNQEMIYPLAIAPSNPQRENYPSTILILAMSNNLVPSYVYVIHAQ